MKRIFASLWIVSLVSVSCNDQSKVAEQDLSGMWILRKVVSYNNGKESISYQEETGAGGWAGTKDNPMQMEFTKYGEVVFSRKNNKIEPYVYQYKINGDTLDLGEEKKYMAKLGNDTLKTVSEMKIDYIDKAEPHGKWIMTDYYTR